MATSLGASPKKRRRELYWVPKWNHTSYEPIKWLGENDGFQTEDDGATFESRAWNYLRQSVSERLQVPLEAIEALRTRESELTRENYGSIIRARLRSGAFVRAALSRAACVTSVHSRIAQIDHTPPKVQPTSEWMRFCFS